MLLEGCGLFHDEPAHSSEPVSYRWVENAEGLHVREAQTRVFRDSAEWGMFWNKHISLFDENYELYPPESVNFNHHTVVAVFWGCQYVGCRNSVNAIDGIYESDGQIEVELDPLPDLGPCRTVQLPLQVVTIPHSEKPIDFTGKIPEQRKPVEKCSPPIQCPPWECESESPTHETTVESSIR